MKKWSDIRMKMSPKARARSEAKTARMISAMKGSAYTCPKCNGETQHNEEFDVYFCAECDVYSEKACSDPACLFCSKRPELPSQMAAHG